MGVDLVGPIIIDLPAPVGVVNLAFRNIGSVIIPLSPYAAGVWLSFAIAA
jgi:hypothetical protein